MPKIHMAGSLLTTFFDATMLRVVGRGFDYVIGTLVSSRPLEIGVISRLECLFLGGCIHMAR
jgi:hypothetical protein